MMIFSVTLLLLCARQIFSEGNDAGIIVEIEDGKLSGTTYTTVDGRVLTAFLGIPYAAPPVDERKFMAPQKLKPWTGVYKATTLPGACMQYTDIEYKIIGEEDCLYLNVFMPRPPKEGDELLDVLVFIHGGAFMFGIGHNKFPDYIMRKNDFVYVSFNYRLGILGFMSTGDPLLPGNNGLKDQAMALKWVKNNIAKFRGNPDNITLCGSSAGGASLHYHMLSNASNGLFHKAISFSGSVMPPWTLPLNNTEKSLEVAKSVGCPQTPVKDLLTCLKQRQARQIVETAADLFTTWQYEPFTAFGPTIEPDNPDSFLTEHPTHLLKSGRMKDLPFMVSLCKDEGLYRAASYITDKDALKRLDTEWNIIAPHMFMYNYSVPEEEKEKVGNAIKRYYFGEEPVSEKTGSQLIQAYGDRAFYNDIVKAVKIQASLSHKDVYCYKFSYRGKYSMSNRMTKNFEDYGVNHADDVAYMVTYLTNKMTETTSDAAMVELLGKIVTHFMKYGNGNFDGQNRWEPVSRTLGEKFRCMEIHSPDKYDMVNFENERTTEFWEKLLPAENID